MYALGLDLGSSSAKASLVNRETHEVAGTVKYPETEMPIHSPKVGFAEQDPEFWWECVVESIRLVSDEAKVSTDQISCIGIAYQMHGLVLVDENQQVLRPAIIWCDSRAIAEGAELENALGLEYCHQNLLNTPGNFTASKLLWVKHNEPEIYKRIDRFMLPGDFIAMKLSGKVNTTVGGLSEGIFWDFKSNQISKELLDKAGFDHFSIFPQIVPQVGIQSTVSQAAHQITGIPMDTPITYRAGDQPNNALALGVLETGEIAATAGTSGVIYLVTDRFNIDSQGKVNVFSHVNYEERSNLGILLCINGCGIQYKWLRELLDQSSPDYETIEEALIEIPAGAEGVKIYPFGNGAERMFGNQEIGARINGLDFNRHSKYHLYRAGIEGIAFSFVYGVELLKKQGHKIGTLKAGNDNLFQSAIFSQALSDLSGCRIQLMETNGAIGAAKASIAGFEQRSLEEVIRKNQVVKEYKPKVNPELQTVYQDWKQGLEDILKKRV